MLSTIRLIFGTRWARFVLAVVALLCAAGVTASVFATSAVMTRTGAIAHLGTITDANTGAYKYDVIQLAGVGASYHLDRTQFTPSLAAGQLTAGTTVEIWYTQSPLNDPYIIALQVSDAQNGTTTKYVTDFYTHPEDSRTPNLILAAFLVVIALALAAAGFFLPAAAKPRKQPASTNPWYP